MGQLFIGVDGGGTWTKGAICDASGSVLAVSSAPSAAPNVVGLETATRNVAAVLQNLSDRTAHLHGALAGVCVSGASPAVCDALRAGPLARIPFMHTGEALGAYLSAPTISPRGVVVVLGTGSAAERSDGSRSVGGWGWALGDEGGGTWMGREAARAALRMLHTGERSLLGELVLRRTGRTAEDVFRYVYRTDSVPGSLGNLAHLVTKCAENGDPSAMEIVDTAARHAWELAAQLLEPGDDVVFVGKVARAMERELRDASPEGTNVFVVPDSVTGALTLAAELAFLDLDRATIADSLAELQGHLAPPALLERVPAI